MTTWQNWCLSPQKELCISIGYILLPLLVMRKFPSNSVWRIWYYIRVSSKYECTCLQYCSDMQLWTASLGIYLYNPSKYCNSFADIQLQMSAPPDRIYELLHSIQSCMRDVKAWATANMLKLSDNKTELILVTSKRTMHLHSLPTSITIGNAQIPFKQCVKNLGFTLECHLTMNAHVSNIARTCYFELRRLASICIFHTSTATATIVSAFAMSSIDYCSSLLFGSTHDVTSHL